LETLIAIALGFPPDQRQIPTIFDFQRSLRLSAPPPRNEALAFGICDLAKISHAPPSQLAIEGKIKNLAISNHFC
jgi:hypothetical protein